MFDLVQYGKDLEAAGVPKELIDKLTTEVKPGFMRQDDYSRKSKLLQDATAVVQSDYQKLQVYEQSIQELEAQYGPREQWNEAFKRAVGERNPDGGGRMPTAD